MTECYSRGRGCLAIVTSTFRCKFFCLKGLYINKILTLLGFVRVKCRWNWHLYSQVWFDIARSLGPYTPSLHSWAHAQSHVQWQLPIKVVSVWIKITFILNDSGLVSISTTFYVQIFCANIIWAAFFLHKCN